MIREGDIDIKQSMEALLKGEYIQCPIDEQIVYNHLNEDESAIWSLLLASGYLKVESHESYDTTSVRQELIYTLAITNAETIVMFYDMVRSWFRPVKRYYNGFVKALFRDDIEEMNIYMNHVALDNFLQKEYRQNGYGSMDLHLKGRMC